MVPQWQPEKHDIKYNWTNRSPVRGVPYDNFSARWRGQFQFQDGPYEFRTLADDGVRVMLDGQPIIEQWEVGSGQEYRIEITPGAGMHLVEVEYFETTDNAAIEVNWEPISSEDNTSSGLASKPEEAAENLTSTITDDSLTKQTLSKKFRFNTTETKI